MRGHDLQRAPSFPQGVIDPIEALAEIARARGAGLHVEPGLWVSVPPTSDPDQPETLVRQATIPHGDALVAQSTLLSEMATPRIDPVDTRPFRIVTERRSPASTR